MSPEIIKTPIGFGVILAMIISWDQNKSILWAIVHGFFGWFYVLYFYLGKKD